MPAPIVDQFGGIVRPEIQPNEVYGLALIIPRDKVPSVGRFEKVELRLLSISSLDTGEDFLTGVRELVLTGLPD